MTDRRAPILLEVRPRKITILAAISASLAVASMVVIGLLLRNDDLGVTFRVADQIGLIGLGVLLGAAIMTAARPRLRADENGLWVRNVVGQSFVPWPLVLRISFPQGAPWAQIVMPDDELKPLMAIQAMDKGRAVAALERVRALHRQYAPPPPVRPPGTELTEDPPRPLGRLEIIDRQMAAERDADAARKAARKGRDS